METRDLDRLASKIEMDPLKKQVLRKLRKSAISGKVDGPYESKYSWTVVTEDCGLFNKVTFSLKKVTDGPKED
jgi:hypothetical protein